MRIESRLSKCYWTCLALLLLSHTSLAGLASRSMIREKEEPRGMLSQGLDSLLERQDVLEDTVDFLDNLEADFLIALEELIIDQEAQDRVLLEDVQVNYDNSKLKASLMLPLISTCTFPKRVFAVRIASRKYENKLFS